MFNALGNNIGAFTITEFCAAFKISRSHFYQLQKSKIGPVTMNLGRRVCISYTSASDWAQKMELSEPFESEPTTDEDDD